MLHRSFRTAALVLGFATAGAGAQAPAAKAAAKPLDDPTIVAIFDAANTWDIATGTLAKNKGVSKEVQDFGAMIAHDHTVVRQQGRDLAKKLGVTPTAPKDFGMEKDHYAAMGTLNAATGAAFDKAFLQHEVAYHQAVIDALNTTLLPALKNQEVIALVKKVAPAFAAHRDAAKNILDKMK